MTIIDSQVHAYEANTPKRPWHSVPNWPDHVTGDDIVATPEEIVPAINTAKAAGASALNVLATSLLFNNRRIIFERVAALRMPAIYQFPEMAEESGLIGYGPRLVQIYRELMTRQVVKLLRGAKVADLPVEQPTKFELVINLQTATVIGHEIPAGLVLRADKVIE
jgi:ABC-type uncharacterized transport system substrate-binding protein